MKLRIAACEYPISRLNAWSAWEEKLRVLCTAAAGRGAEVLVFPEYAGMELTSLLEAEECADLQRSIRGLQSMREAYLAAHRQLAAELGVTILAGSLPWECGGVFVNRAWLCLPDGSAFEQDKIIMTRFEREQWIIHGGSSLKVFDLPGGVRAGVLICYDSEFPLLARRLCEAGADLLLVPSCTDTEAGYHRVMLSCRARALEQQCFVIQSPTAGCAEWSPAVDVNTGRAGVFGPVDTGFPDDGVLACGAPPETAPWLMVDLPLARLGSVRRHGQVRNAADWPEQFRAVLPAQG
jgi:predicted amidohydrolase